VAEAGVVVQIRACREGWRRVSAGDYQGWVRASALWGPACGDDGEEPQALQALIGR